MQHNKEECWQKWVGDAKTHSCFECKKWIVRKRSLKCANIRVKAKDKNTDRMRPVCSECYKQLILAETKN